MAMLNSRSRGSRALMGSAWSRWKQLLLATHHRGLALSASDVSSNIHRVSRRGPTGCFMIERAATNPKLLNLGLESTSLGLLLGWSNLRVLRERWAWRERKGNGVTTDTHEFIMILVGTENPQGFRTLKGGHKPQAKGGHKAPHRVLSWKICFS